MSRQYPGISQRPQSWPLPKGLIVASSICFLLFWLGVILGKLRIAYRLDIPVIPELALLLVLALAIIFGLSACLKSEQRRDQFLRNNK